MTMFATLATLATHSTANQPALEASAPAVPKGQKKPQTRQWLSFNHRNAPWFDC